VTERIQTFEPFATERAYIRVNEKLVDRMLKSLPGRERYRVLDIAAGTGLMTCLAQSRARAAGAEIDSVLVDIDLPALREARRQVPPDAIKGCVSASADRLPLREGFDLAVFANSLHLLNEQAKLDSLAETRRILHAGGALAVNTTFYEGAYPEESKRFYSHWLRRAVPEVNRRLPHRVKSQKAQAMEWLPALGYKQLIAGSGFKVIEMRERRVLLGQAAVRSISSYKEFAMGALHATEEDAEEASRALQATVRQTFRELKMKYLPRNWLEVIALKA